MSGIKSISGTSVKPSNGAAAQDMSGYWNTVMSERIAASLQPRGNLDDAQPEDGLDAGQDTGDDSEQ
jgi:hypothetical protein